MTDAANPDRMILTQAPDANPQSAHAEKIARLAAALAPDGGLNGLTLGRPQFVIHNAKKVPINPVTGLPCDLSDPSNWLTVEAALAHVRARPEYGIGWRFTAEDKFGCIDLDNCREGKGWNAFSLSIVNQFAGAYVEVSQSNRGLHIIFSYTGTPPPHRKRGDGIELYVEGQYVALTGNCNG